MFLSRRSSQLSAFRIGASNPPTITSAWTVSQNGRGSPFVTSTDGTNNVIVWTVGSEGDQQLHGYDGDTGSVVYSGGGANELMTGTRRFNTAIAAHGRIYAANDNKVYAFTVPVLPIALTNLALLANGSFQFGFANTPGMNFNVYETPNLATPFNNWTRLGVPWKFPPAGFNSPTRPAPATRSVFIALPHPEPDQRTMPCRLWSTGNNFSRCGF